MERENCEHKVLSFGSGDYYIFCANCDARWVCTNTVKDIGSPELANKGIGCTLSGHIRSTPSGEVK